MPNTATVVTVNHQLVTIAGLPVVRPGAVVAFADDGLGLVTGFNQEYVEAIVFNEQPVPVGTAVTLLQQTFEVPVSGSLLGRVISPLGKALDSKRLAESEETRHYNTHPLPLPQRSRIQQQCLTGVGVVDLLLPIGMGQRELVVGDQKAGKTAFLEQAAIAQARRGTIVIWAAIGQTAGEIKHLTRQLDAAKIWDQTIVVATMAQESASQIYLTPFTALTMAEYFRDQGLDTLVILDDLTTHARAYRELALLAKRFPGRDSYPGDMFYIHARLLERAGSFTHPTLPDQTVTITCLPVAETHESDLTSYIVSNLISITDGHLLFDTQLFNQGQRPAVNIGLSVTRVGKQTQTKLQRDLSRELTAFLAEYSQTEKLVHFGAELTDATQQVIKKGQSLQAFFSQEPSTTMSADAVVIGAMLIWLGWWQTVERLQMLAQRDHLVAQLKLPTGRKLAEQLLAQPDLTALTNAMHEHRAELEDLCRV